MERKMKFLETLGRWQGQKGVFQYKRTSNGVVIDSSIGNNSSLNPPQLEISNAEWSAILTQISTSGTKTFGITVGGGNGNPSIALDGIINAIIPGLNPSWISYICAILEHEGSLETYTGALGQGYQSRIDLVRDI
jgi:hypothetical protein